MRPLFVWSGAVVLVLARLAAGQCSLATTFAGGNAQRGNMFDVVATRPLQVTGFDLDLTPGAHTIQVFTKTGSWTSAPNNQNAWTLLTFVPVNVTSLGPGSPTNLPLLFSAPIALGATRAFYVVTAAPQSLVYSTGTVVGAIAAQDANLRILEGAGVSGSFGSAYTPRIWNGRVRYVTGQPEYQTNQAGASIAVNGLQGTACSKAVTNVSICSAVSSWATLQLSMSSSASGAPFDLFVTSGPPVAASTGAYISQHGQVLNLNLADPTLTPLLGLAYALPFSDATYSLTANQPLDVTFQMVVLDPLSPDNGWLSQVNEVHVTDASQPPPLQGPDEDDEAETYSFSKIAFGPTSFQFYNTSYSTFSVVSNGRVMFGGSDTTFLPAASLAAADAPSINAWADFDPGSGGNISIFLAAPGVVRVQWTGVPYWSPTPVGANTFRIDLDATVPAITIHGLSAFQPLVSAPMLLGLSPGSPIAANPGPTAFSLGGPHPGPAGNGMLYDFGPVGTLASGCAGIVFLPNGAGNYTWSAY